MKPAHISVNHSHTATPDLLILNVALSILIVAPHAYPLIPETITTYTLKTNFTPDEIRTFAQKVGMNDVKESKTDYVTLSDLADKNKGYGLLNKNSGSFNLQMYGDQRPHGYKTGMSPQQEALVYLQELGITDESVTCPITYQRTPFTGQNGYTYAECHRDWQKLGLPVYSLIGLLNTPANIQLNSLMVGKVRSDSPLDKSVTNVSTGQDGYARPNDFNTATVGIKNDGAIESISSSFKIIQNKQTVAKKDILTTQEALELFKSHKALLSLTIPDGNGSVQWEKVYQNNEANADQAIVTDMILSYLERPLSEAQDSFVPMYVIRGYALLKTGYTVRFVEVVPALRSQAAYLSDSTNLRAVAGEQTKRDQNNAALQLKTFTPPTATPTPTATPIPTVTPAPSATLILTSIPTYTSQPAPSKNPTTGGMSLLDLISNRQLQTLSDCNTPTGGETITLNVPGYGKLNVFNISRFKHIFYLSSTELSTNDLNIIREAFLKAVENQYVKNVTYRLISDFQASVASIKTRDDVKNLFLAISQKDGTWISSGACYPVYEAQEKTLYGAPFFCPGTSVDKKYDSKRFIDMANNVADRILSAIANNSLAEEGKKPDQYPPTTLKHLDWAIYETATIGLSQEYASCYITGESPSLFVYPAKKSM